HDVGVELAPTFDSAAAMTRAVERADPDLVLCPFLKHRVPSSDYDRWPTVIVHPAPLGVRGPSALDHAIRDGREQWGVTALSAVGSSTPGPCGPRRCSTCRPAPCPRARCTTAVSPTPRWRASTRWSARWPTARSRPR